VFRVSNRLNLEINNLGGATDALFRSSMCNLIITPRSGATFSLVIHRGRLAARLPMRQRGNPQKEFDMLGVISSHSSIATMTNSCIRLVVDGALAYALVLLPQEETGIYSWSPVKRILVLIFFPFVLLYSLITNCCRGDCSGCCHRCDDDS